MRVKIESGLMARDIRRGNMVRHLDRGIGISLPEIEQKIETMTGAGIETDIMRGREQETENVGAPTEIQRGTVAATEGTPEASHSILT
jgi:hypothetical protein